MSCLKFSLFLLLFLTLDAFAINKFTAQQCLDSNFDATIIHEGALFGLIKKNLSIKKNKCQLEITYKNILPTIWKIDICREPIHMKVTSKGSQEVYKRSSGCSSVVKMSAKNEKGLNHLNSEYCEMWGELKEKIQDYGLIYADGEREFLSHAHGQTYCTYLLLRKYLEQGILFSSYEKSPEIYKIKDANTDKGDEKKSWNSGNYSDQNVAPTSSNLNNTKPEAESFSEPSYEDTAAEGSF